MTSRDPSDDEERDTLADRHREASKAVDERPDPRVRERVLAAAREAEAFNRARDAREKARREPTAWPKSVAAVLAVAVVTAFVAGRLWPDRIEVDGAPTTVATPSRDTMVAVIDTPSKTEGARAGSTAAPAGAVASRSTVDGDAIARERRPDRRAFSRDRDEPVVVSRKPTPTPAAAENEAAPAQLAQADVARPAEAMAAEPRVAAAPAAAPLVVAAPTSVDDGAHAFNARRAKAADSSIGMAALAAAPPSPEAWVQSIVQLRRAGNDTAADAELKRLRQRYPDFAVPVEASAPAARP